MESTQKLLKLEAEKLLTKIPGLIPPESKKFVGPLANSLKLATRMLQGFPKSEMKGVEWLFDVLGTLAPGMIASLTEAQIREAALKAIDLGIQILDSLPPEQE